MKLLCEFIVRLIARLRIRICLLFDSRIRETLYKNLKNVFNLSEVGKAINYVELFSKWRIATHTAPGSAPGKLGE